MVRRPSGTGRDETGLTRPRPRVENGEASGLTGRIRKSVLEAIINARHRRTARDLEREMASRAGCSRLLVKTAIRGLIETGILEYRYTFGQSYLAMSFRRPVDVSPRFTIVPPGYSGGAPSFRIPIVIAPGVAFGDGRHPTTRLALHALELAWAHLQQNNATDALVAMDIGTGSGILAIAAACLGAETVFGLDIDACARSEALANIGLNPKAAGIDVTDRPLDAFDLSFDLVMANLRLPTLVDLADWMEAHLKATGCVVVSGCREEEWDRLSDVYATKGLHSGWQAAMGGWVGGLFHLEANQGSKPSPAQTEQGDRRL